LLVSKEYRHEKDSYDYRLPGGKVFDSLEVYLSKLDDESKLESYVLEAARREAHEEAGLDIERGEIIYTSVAGATINWDLYYVEVKDFSDSVDGQELEMGEDIDTLWVTSRELKELIKNGDFSEDRSVGVLFRFGFID
jgi:8-oxo-dGTP pyrophosphatase MutT (NUDIX family)